jgi:hypothetical protein
MVEVLKTQIQSGGSPSRIIALGWVHHLFECLQEKVICWERFSTVPNPPDCQFREIETIKLYIEKRIKL